MADRLFDVRVEDRGLGQQLPSGHWTRFVILWHLTFNVGQ
jgi:hypothetical protein